MFIRVNSWPAALFEIPLFACVVYTSMNNSLMNLEKLEPRQLFAFDIPAPLVDLRVDANRDGIINSLDNPGEDRWTSGKGGKGSLVLPNFDRDNKTTDAPDNWTGGNWNGRHVAPNNVIDNTLDLNDIGKLRLSKLVNLDASFRYEVTLKLLPAKDDPGWLKNVPASSRVRVFMPSKEISNGRVVCQPGDSAIIGPGIGDTIKFIYAPVEANEYPLSMLRGDGYLELGVEGLRAGAGVRFQLTVSYQPVIIFDTVDVDDGGVEPEILTDEVAMRVSPFVLQDHRREVSSGKGSVVVDKNNENTAMRDALRSLFGDRLLEAGAGDLWQQDGCEIGYVAAPYGTMPVVLELPRSRGEAMEGGTGIRAVIRGKLLNANVGVCTDVASLPYNSSSLSGGDIESLPIPQRPDVPGFLLRSKEMPAALKQFFDAQGVNKPLELDLDKWLAVGHVDEVVSLSSNGKDLFMADAELGYAMLLWSHQLNPRARMHAGMSYSLYLPGQEEKGVEIRDLLKNGRVRAVNLKGVMSSGNLPAAQSTIVEAMGLTREVSTPRADAANRGGTKLLRGGVFTQLLDGKQRYYEVKFLDADRYELRWKITGQKWSSWLGGRKSRDELFPDARAYLLSSQWSGSGAKPGDQFRFHTNVNPTMIKMPVLFYNGSTFADFGDQPVPDGFEEQAVKERVVALTSNVINSLVDASTIIAAKAFGPKVNWSGKGASDLFDDYTRSAFKQNGFSQVVLVDARPYHNASGGVHCGTNVFRDLPADAWWQT